MARWLNTNTILGVMFGGAFAIPMTVVLGPAAGIPLGLGVALMWAVALNMSRTAGGTETDKDAD